MSFLSVAILMAVALPTFCMIWPRKLAGDKPKAT